MPSRFPKPRWILDSYEEYKQCQRDLLDWMLRSARNLGISYRIKRGPEGELTLDTDEWPKLAAKIVDQADFIPPGIIKLVEECIEGREKLSRYYQIKYPEYKKANESHIIFISRLKEVRDIFKTAGHSRKRDVVETFSLSLGAMSIGIEDDDQSGPSRSSDEDLDDFNLISEDDEVQLSAWFLLHDLHSLREYIQKTWADYVAGKLSLITASIITTQAVEIAKEMEAVFFERFNQRFEASRDYISMVDVLLSVENEEAVRQICPPDVQGFMMLGTWTCIYKFSTELRQGFAPKLRQDFCAAFDPNADRSTMSEEERDAEDICLLMTHLPDVAAQAIRSGSGCGQKCSNHTIDEESLVQGLRNLIDDPKRPIPIHLVFQWEVWKDIVLVNRRNLQRPLDELRSIVGSIVSSAEGWVSAFDSRFYIAGMKSRVQKGLVDKLREEILVDSHDAWKRQQGITDSVSFRPFLYNPWACGIAAANSIFIAHDMGVYIANNSEHLVHVLQLYNALLQHGRVAHWPDMDRLIDICSPIIFRGGSPNPLFVSVISLSTGRSSALAGGWWDPQSNRTGAAFPMRQGSSILAQLSSERYRLSDHIIMKLSPDSIDNTTSKDAGDADNRRHDPLVVLDALRQRAEAEISSTGLTVDLFAAQRMSLVILQRWRTQVGRLLARVLGPEYDDRPGVPGCVVKYLFMALKTPGLIPAGAADKMIAEAVKVIEEGRGGLGIVSMRDGRMSYVR
ncbi:hypothetical protein BD779DRAFT_763778 [Infundibulicybe gibba]|nr:hypothetical protein BD779DRAFT_763778 [Infundibulicybe gibba]